MTSYKKKNRCSLFTIVKDETGNIPMTEQVKLVTLKACLKGTGTSLRLRGRKPNNMYYDAGMPCNRGYAGAQDLPLVYAQEIDVYLRVNDLSNPECRETLIMVGNIFNGEK